MTPPEPALGAGLAVGRGSFDDNLLRFILTRRTWTLGRVFRFTGDHPTADADLVDALVAATTGAEHSYGRVDPQCVTSRPYC